MGGAAGLAVQQTNACTYSSSVVSCATGGSDGAFWWQPLFSSPTHLLYSGL